MKTNALLIFTRNPELGKVKTRLAATIGPEKALKVYTDLLLHTRNETQSIDCDKFVFYDNYIPKEDIWLDTIYHKQLQSEGDLGQRMQHAFEVLFEMGYSNCIIVGSDLFELKTALIENAFENLNTYESVIGPAIDGGYYLLGLKGIKPALFQNKDWGTNTVYEATLKDLVTEKTFVLPALNDIDTFEDLEKSGYIL